MKILIIQLARLGDVFLTWPAIKAYKRNHPDAQIDLLTRPRFADGAVGLKEVTQVHCIPTKAILAPLVSDLVDVDLSRTLLRKFISVLKEEKYDLVVNMTFSPFSSYLTHALEQEGAKVIGYSRHSDGFLSIPDDMSAYFYAQAGKNRPNRYHLADIFGSLLEVDLQAQDWHVDLPELPAMNANVQEELQSHAAKAENSIVIQIGTSESKKSLSVHFWGRLVAALQAVRKESIVLIGSDSEKKYAEDIITYCGPENLINLVGKTKVSDLFHIIKSAKLVIGGDSVAQHIASLCETKSLNLSSMHVNFWETGPRAKGSYVFRFENEEQLNTNEIVLNIISMLQNENLAKPYIRVIEDRPSYISEDSMSSNYRWNLVKALYLQENFPLIMEEDTYIGFERLHEVAVVLFEQYEKISAGVDIEKLRSIIDRADEIVAVMEKLCPDIGPVVRWYQTEKARMAPDSEKKVAGKLMDLTKKLLQICEVYVQVEDKHGNAELQK